MKAGRQAAEAGRSGLAALVLTLVLLGVLASSAGAQEVEDWDSVDNPAYDSAETDTANRDITEAQDDNEAAEEEQDNLGCSLCAESAALDEQMDAAYEDTREGVAELVDARAQAIEEAPGESEEELDDKLDALDTLENYAIEWGPGRETGGLADPAKVEAAQEEVGAQLSAASAESESDEGEDRGSTSSPEETTSAPEETGAEPAAPDPEPAGGVDDGGSGDGGGPGDDGGGDGGSGEDSGSDTGGPLAGLQNLFSGFSLVSLLAAALIIVGVAYYLVGLVREGLGSYVKRKGSPQTASASKPKSKPRKPKPKGGAEADTGARRGTGGEPEGPEREAPERPEKPSGKSPGDRATKTEEPDAGSAIADRLKRMRSEEADPRHPTAEELNDLFDGLDQEDDEDGEEGR